MKTRIRLSLVLATASITAALVFAGCGGGGGTGGSDLASLVPADAPVFVQGAIKPTGDLKTNIESLISKFTGDSTDVSQQITDQLDAGLGQGGGDVSYTNDIEPWLGENAAIYVSGFSTDSQQAGAIIQTTDSGAAQDFIDKQSAASDSPVTDGSYQGVDYKESTDPVDGSNTVVGIVSDSVVVTEDTATFDKIVDASKGDSLSDNDAFQSAMDAVPDGSLADIYVDVDSFAKEVTAQLDPQSAQFYNSLNLNTAGSTAVASVVPGSDQIEFDVTSNSTTAAESTGDATDLISSFPGDSIAALGVPGVGAQLASAIDKIDTAGIGGTVKPGELKSQLGVAGLNVDKFVSSIGSVGFFAEGTNATNLSGALVMETSDQTTATQTIAKIGKMLASTGQPIIGVKSSRGTGFGVRMPAGSALGGSSRIYMVTKDDRIAIGTNLASIGTVLDPQSTNTLADNPEFGSAGEALQGVGMNGFVDFTQISKIASNAMPSAAYEAQIGGILDKLSFLAIGSEQNADAATSKAILKLAD